MLKRENDYNCCSSEHIVSLRGHKYRDCNPGLEFSIPGFGIVEFPIPGSHRYWRSIVKTTKIAKWVTVFVSLFLNYKCARSCYGLLMCCKPYSNILLQLLLS